MIPKIIHQTWKNENIPPEYIRFQEKVKQLHPDWEYKLWTDEDNLDFVKTFYPDFLETYTGFPKNIMRADAIRYLLMHQLGGVYLDLDYEMLKPFDLTGYDLVLPYNRNTEFGDDSDAIGNCIFGSVPGQDFWKLAIEDLKVKRDYEQYFKTLAHEPYISKRTTLEEAITGPAFLTRIFFDNRDKLKNLFLPPRSWFHPVNTGLDKDFTKLSAEGKTYGIHHCSGSWRSKSLIKAGLHKLKGMLKS